MTDARCDQEHIEMMIINKPSIPDRTDYILGKSTESPLFPMIEAGRALVASGADYIAIPCITAHYFHEELSDGISVPIIHIIKETVNCLKEQGVDKAGIMATEGTISSRLFQEELSIHGICPVVPSRKGQKIVSDLIYQNIKAGLPAEMDRFHTVTEELKENGASVIILGCTELSLIKRDVRLGHGFLDAMEVLAGCSVNLCGARLKKDYRNLIT